jgi:transposase
MFWPFRSWRRVWSASSLCLAASLVALAQALGHRVRLMPPAYVKPYVKRQKNDAADAEAICEAVERANMRFVETKTPEGDRVPDRRFEIRQFINRLLSALLRHAR